MVNIRVICGHSTIFYKGAGWAPLATVHTAHSNATHDATTSITLDREAGPALEWSALIVGVPGASSPGEARVALIPPVAAKLEDQGHDVCVAAGAGEGSNWSNADYLDAGCELLGDPSEVFERADVILQISGLAAAGGSTVDQYRDGQVVIGMLGPYQLEGELEDLAERNVSAFALELIPRIGRAQRMDVLSSMASIGGYKAVAMAAEASPVIFPMEMTAAGTIQPANVFVIGAGVAGLKAIATANRLGAAVSAYDIRLEVRQEVKSLGAEFVELDLETEGSGDDEGYAREMDEEFYRQQRTELSRVVAESDVVITTAAIPGRPAPELVSTEMVDAMRAGSVIVDLSAATGGNCELTAAGETIHHQGITVMGPTNLPATVPRTASQLFANNLNHFLQNLLEEGELTIDTGDEIVDATLLTHAGEVRAPHRSTADGDADAAADGDVAANGGSDNAS